MSTFSSSSSDDEMTQCSRFGGGRGCFPDLEGKDGLVRGSVGLLSWSGAGSTLASTFFVPAVSETTTAGSLYTIPAIG
jgi:hypothetical protein